MSKHAEKRASGGHPGPDAGAKILRQLTLLEQRQPGSLPAVILPSLQGKVIHGMCIGPNWQNMAVDHEPQSTDAVQKRNRTFLEVIGAESLENAFFMKRVDRNEPIQFADITSEMKHVSTQGENTETVMNDTEAMITTEEGIPLVMRIADCFGAIVYGKTATGKPILAILHLSRDMIDRQLIGLVADHLKTQYHCTMEDMQVGILPGMGYPNNTITTADSSKFLTGGAWPDEFMDSREDGFTYLKPLEYAVSQFNQAGIPRSNIEAYGGAPEVDTFDLAQLEPPQAASYRFATRRFREIGTDNRKQRNLVVAQLPKTA